MGGFCGEVAELTDGLALREFAVIDLAAAWFALVKSSRPINEISAVAMQRAYRICTEAMYAKIHYR